MEINMLKLTRSCYITLLATAHCLPIALIAAHGGDGHHGGGDDGHGGFHERHYGSGAHGYGGFHEQHYDRGAINREYRDNFDHRGYQNRDWDHHHDDNQWRYHHYWHGYNWDNRVLYTGVILPGSIFLDINGTQPVVGSYVENQGYYINGQLYYYINGQFYSFPK